MRPPVHIRRWLLVACLVALLWPQVLHSQIDLTPLNKELSAGSQPRTVSLAVTMGVLELVSAGVLVQFSDRYSLGLVASAVLLGHSNGTWGVGVRWSYYFSRPGENDFLFLNALMVDCQYLKPANGELISWRNPGGVGLEAVAGQDGQIGAGLGIIWGLGLSMAFDQGAPPLITPAIRLGFHIDV
jgi:hypothetical protein